MTGVLVASPCIGLPLALENGGTNAWFSLVHPVTMLVFAVTFVCVDVAGRHTWSERDARRKRLKGGGEGEPFQTITQASSEVPAARSAGRRVADLVVTLLTLFATLGVLTLCKCPRTGCNVRHPNPASFNALP